MLKFYEKATKIWKNLRLVLKLLSKPKHFFSQFFAFSKHFNLLWLSQILSWNLILKVFVHSVLPSINHRDSNLRFSCVVLSSKINDTLKDNANFKCEEFLFFRCRAKVWNISFYAFHFSIIFNFQKFSVVLLLLICASIIETVISDLVVLYFPVKSMIQMLKDNANFKCEEIFFFTVEQKFEIFLYKITPCFISNFWTFKLIST